MMRYTYIMSKCIQNAYWHVTNIDTQSFKVLQIVKTTSNNKLVWNIVVVFFFQINRKSHIYMLSMTVHSRHEVQQMKKKSGQNCGQKFYLGNGICNSRLLEDLSEWGGLSKMIWDFSFTG